MLTPGKAKALGAEQSQGSRSLLPVYLQELSWLHTEWWREKFNVSGKERENVTNYFEIHRAFLYLTRPALRRCFSFQAKPDLLKFHQNLRVQLKGNGQLQFPLVILCYPSGPEGWRHKWITESQVSWSPNYRTTEPFSPILTPVYHLLFL